MTSGLAGLKGGGEGSSGGNGNGNGNGRGSRHRKKIKPATIRAYKYTTQEYGLAEEIFLESEGKPKFLLLDPKTEEPMLKDPILGSYTNKLEDNRNTSLINTSHGSTEVYSRSQHSSHRRCQALRTRPCLKRTDALDKRWDRK